jgi:hypothetical protein
MAQLDALPYRMYLLCYDLDRRRLFDRTRAAFLTRAAVLTELALRAPDDAATAQRHFALVVRGTAPAASVSDADAALVALAAGGRARTVLTRRDRLGHADRIGELSGRLALVAPGLADAVRALDRTIVAAQAGTGGS